MTKKWNIRLSFFTVMVLCLTTLFSNGSFVKAASVEGIFAVLEEGTILKTGDTLQKSNLLVYLVSSDGSTSRVRSSRINFVDPENPTNELDDEIEITATTSEPQIIMIEYDDYYYTMVIKIDSANNNNDNWYLSKKLSSIHAEYNGTKVAVGSAINRANVKVYVFYDVKYENSKGKIVTTSYSERLTSGWTFEDYSIASGQNTVTIKYTNGGITVRDTIKVESSDTSGNWIQEGNEWRYKFEDGSYLIGGWIKTDGHWYYLSPDGFMVKDGFVDIDNVTYWFTPSGEMWTGWVKYQGNWYFFNEDGKMGIGWVKDGDTWYYCNKKGIMQTDWLFLDDNWYFLQEDGAMKIGWVQRGSWHYMDPINGNMLSERWISDGNKWYYVDKGGAMVTNTWVGKYYVDHTGAWTQTKQ